MLKLITQTHGETRTALGLAVNGVRVQFKQHCSGYTYIARNGGRNYTLV